MTTEQVADAWTLAYQAEIAKIEAHPRFPRMIREVAIAEQSAAPGYRRLRTNSYTYGIWMTRGMPYFDKTRRARALSRAIALELWPTDDPDGHEAREKAAKVYVAARDWVRSRRLPGLAALA